MEEINENFKNIDFFSCIMDGLQEALSYKKVLTWTAICNDFPLAIYPAGYLQVLPQDIQIGITRGWAKGA